MEYIPIVIFAILLGLLLGLLVTVLIRLHYFANEVNRRIDEAYNKNIAFIEAGDINTRHNYPDIDKTYANFKWYIPWQKPSTLIVYENRKL